MNAPPDAFAFLKDGRERGTRSLGDALQGKKRLFVCGLALDYCVMDTCMNAKLSGFKEVFMVVDAARASHIPSVGKFGSGFLNDPKEVRERMETGGCQFTSVERITGEAPSLDVEVAPTFPAHLGPLPLNLDTSIDIRIDSDKQKYKVAQGLFTGLLDRFTGTNEPEGVISPIVPIPDDWPEKPEGVVSFCWGYPMDKYREELLKMKRSMQLMFLALTTSTKLQFCAYGGFLLIDTNGQVAAVQSVSPVIEESDTSLAFGPPQRWDPEFTESLMESGRFQSVTMPFILAAGADTFAWISPGESLAANGKTWTPSKSGAFVYLKKDSGEAERGPRPRSRSG